MGHAGDEFAKGRETFRLGKLVLDLPFEGDVAGYAEGVVVGSCSMVTRSIDEPGTYIGSPAKRLEKKER